MIRIALLGNCQVEVYRQLLESSVTPDITVSAFEIWRHKPPEFAAIYDRLRTYDIVVTQELSAYYGPLATKDLRLSIKQLLIIHNIYFQGYQPDCVYIGPMGARIKSPIGDYHSQTIFDQWSADRSVDDCIMELDNYDPEHVLQVFEASGVDQRGIMTPL